MPGVRCRRSALERMGRSWVAAPQSGRTDIAAVFERLASAVMGLGAGTRPQVEACAGLSFSGLETTLTRVEKRSTFCLRT